MIANQMSGTVGRTGLTANQVLPKAHAPFRGARSDAEVFPNG